MLADETTSKQRTYKSKPNNKMKKDFLVIVLFYISGLATVVFLLPLNIHSGIAMLILLVNSGVLQWYWNKHFKDE